MRVVVQPLTFCAVNESSGVRRAAAAHIWPMSKSGDKPHTPTSALPHAVTKDGSAAGVPYVVLARKYRPSTFDDLIGQEVMVRTLRNAFALDRIAQAYMLTGVRGVGKTTTARILARALNYKTEQGIDRPTLDMPELGIHCQAIMESRHVDVLEMDAASHTGIDDIREIIEAVRYKPASARYRVFIIDEVHMLSKSAFNGLLKTLEEPPPHAKFIFATTEIRKVPVTILSRCQRFDLRRVDQDMLANHFGKIVEAENQKADRDALLVLARAADGSVRDGLSLLDQSLALGNGNVTAGLVRGMIGIAGRSAIFLLLENIFKGESASALSSLASLHDAGGDPLAILNDIADSVHILTRLHAVPGNYPADFSAEDRAYADKLSSSLGVSRLSATWQMILKGLDEVSKAARPFAAAEMLIIRMCYSSNLPSPAEVIKELKGKHAGGNGISSARAPGNTPSPSRSPAQLAVVRPMEPSPPPASADATPGLSFHSFKEIADYAGAVRDIKLKIALEEQSELVKFGQGFLELHLLPGAPPNLGQELSRKLQGWTGERWVVSLSEQRGEVPIASQRRDEEARDLEELKVHPAVKSILQHFPDAEIKSVRKLEK